MPRPGGKSVRASRRSLEEGQLLSAHSAASAAAAAAAAGRGDDDDEHDPNADADLQPIEVRRTPSDQIRHLSEEQLGEVFTKLLTATNPNVSHATTRFSYSDGVFKPTQAGSHMQVHFQMDGVLIHVDSDEAREQADYIAQQAEIERKSVAVETDSSAMADADGAGGAGGGSLSARSPRGGEDESGKRTSSATAGGKGGKGAAAMEEEDEEEEDEDADNVPDDRALKNQFNFSERASQTFNNPLREREVSTEPPPTTDFCGNVSHFDIFDAYVEDLERQLSAKKEPVKASRRGGLDDEEKEAALAGAGPFTGSVSSAAGGKALDLLSSHEGLAAALKTMERMVNQNAEAELFAEYKYFEDKVEAKRGDVSDKRGSFLPLWKLSFDSAAKRKTVTAIQWNPQYSDLFAVAYGSYDFMKQSTGVVCCYSLKNTSYPEYKFTTDSGVMCLDFHPVHTALLVAGLYDGTVCVYDVRSKSNEPLYSSSDPKVKHRDPVWAVRWQREEAGRPLNFYSISSDGRVTNWLMNKNELVNEEVVELKLMSGTKDHEEVPDNAMVGLAGGCAFDFNPVSEHLFVVGTEEGALQSYSKAYNTQFLRAFEGHHMAVYSVRWNPFHPHVFLTCSADWSVKLWELNTTKPVMTFDLQCSVGDVAWAPYSSTVFAVVTSDGKLRVFDLSVNKHEALGETRVNKKAKLTHVVFNPREPILCVGDDRGVVNLLKLSANLRRMSAPSLDEIDVEEEIDKLDRLLSFYPDHSLFPLPAQTANLMPTKSQDQANAKAKAAQAAQAAAQANKPGTQPNTQRDIKSPR